MASHIDDKTNAAINKALAVCRWHGLWTADDLAALHKLSAAIDPGFAERETAWWNSRTDGELNTQMSYAWNCNDGDSYCHARSILALRTRGETC